MVCFIFLTINYCCYILPFRLTPRVLWSQSRHQIRLSVQVRGCEYYHIDSKGPNITVWLVTVVC